MSTAATHPPTAVVRRAGWLGLAAATTVLVADLVVRPLTVAVPAGGWAGGLLAPVASAVILLLPLLIVPTMIRVLAHSGPSPMPVTAARAAVAGVTAALWCTGIGLVAALGTGLTAVTGGAATPVLWVPVILAAVGTLTAGAAARTLKRARAQWAASFGTGAARPAANRPDLIDDLATLIAHTLPGSPTARSGAWLNRRLDVWAWSPRRHRAGFVVASACIAGAVLTGRHAAGGPWSGPLAPPAFAVLAGAVVAAVLGAGIAWLGLLRPLPD